MKKFKSFKMDFFNQESYDSWVDENGFEIYPADYDLCDPETDVIFEVTIGGISPFYDLMIVDAPGWILESSVSL